MSSVTSALRVYENSKKELADAKTAYNTTLALLQKQRAAIKLRHHTMLICEKNYKSAVMEHNGSAPTGFMSTGPHRIAGSIF